MLEELPDSLILQIYKYLDPEDISRIGQCSRKCRRVALDEILWRNVFYSYFRIQPKKFPHPLGYNSWRSEFIRLVDETPVYETEVLDVHTDQVLHVSRSPDGSRFATSSKDGFINVWKTQYPVELEFRRNMQEFNWKYTQYSEFNESGRLLLVSGVLLGGYSTSGEIAIFNLTDFSLRCRVSNKPYDIFGCWYSEEFLLSGDLDWLDNFVSQSTIWLNLASQEVDSEHSAVVNKLYKFYNPMASSIRSIMISNCVQEPFEVSINHDDESQIDEPADSDDTQPSQSKSINQSSVDQKVQEEEEVTMEDVENSQDTSHTIVKTSTSDERTKIEAALGVNEEDENDDENMDSSKSSLSSSSNDLSTESFSDGVIDTREKYLIFTCGKDTYSPHMVGFKKIPPFSFKSRVEHGPSIQERMEVLLRRQVQEAINYGNYSNVAHLFDTIDCKLDLEGHIIGMCLSPDHRYLYVNSRPWPKGYEIFDPLNPPPIAQEIDVHVIDMLTLKQIGVTHRSHRAFTPNEECFFIFLDCSMNYLASGSEDKNAYTWERHYEIALAKLPHTDVVNSVAFNPNEDGTLISVSDDKTIKIWRSRSVCRKLNIDISKCNVGTKLYRNQKTARLSTTNNME